MKYYATDTLQSHPHARNNFPKFPLTSPRFRDFFGAPKGKVQSDSHKQSRKVLLCCILSPLCRDFVPLSLGFLPLSGLTVLSAFRYNALIRLKYAGRELWQENKRVYALRRERRTISQKGGI